MKESYGEDLVNHTSLESCGNCSNAVAEALTEGNTVVPATGRTQGRKTVSTGLQGVRRKAKQDKIAQQAAAKILSQIYETDFMGFSYGFREKRSQHDALDAIYVGISRCKISYILDADISGFFNQISHEWLLKFIKHRVVDRRILRLIRKWLKVGFVEAQCYRTLC